MVAVARAGVIAQPAVAYHSHQPAYVQPSVYHHQPSVAVHAQPAILQKTFVQAAPAIVSKTHVDDYDPNPQYQFSYDIHDSLTGDAKSQTESRDGDVVKGQYSLIEADGSRRIVDYTADPVHGFNAVVHKEPGHSVHHAPVAKVIAPTISVHKTVVPTYQKTVIAQPTLTKVVSAPSYHHAQPHYAQPQYVHY